MADLVFTLITVCILAGSATIIKYYNGEMLISGYNSATPEQQKYMSEMGIGRYVGNYLYLLAAVILGGYLARKAGIGWGHWLSWALFAVIIIWMLTGLRRFKPPGPVSCSARNTNIIGTVVLVIAAALITWCALPSEYKCEAGQLTITGAYGTSIKYSDIEYIKLKEKIPEVSMRTNGLGLGPIVKGNFLLADGKSALLFVRANRAPFLLIKIKNKQTPVIINFSDPKQTIALHQQLKSRIE